MSKCRRCTAAWDAARASTLLRAGQSNGKASVLARCALTSKPVRGGELIG
jgi:hypothetical protein